MANKRKAKSIDFHVIQDNLGRQFRNLDQNDPSSWPVLPKLLLCLVIAAAVATALWFSMLKDYQLELEAEEAQEVKLKEEFRGKLQKAVSLEGLKKQREQVQQYVLQLEKQLPSKAEMAALLSDINQAGLGRSLQFEMFKPGAILVKDYYAELPISLRVNGLYHDIGAFSSDIAFLSRIVTLNNISIAPSGKEGSVLVMDATARTYRYLDPEEVLAQRKNGGKK